MNDTLQFLNTLGDEKSDTQSFWNRLLRDYLGIVNTEEYIDFEKRVLLGHISFIDAYIPSTGIVIEQKSRDVDLNSPATQSDGSTLTPFAQARRYYDRLLFSEKGRYIIVCNFEEFRIYDMDTKKPEANPNILKISELTPENLAFIVDKSKPITIEEKLSRRAGELVRLLYESLHSRYDDNDKENPLTLASLNVFCVRIVFLLYAEDAGLFRKAQFHDYLKPRKMMARDALLKLFRVLNQNPEKGEREKYLEPELQEFKYVNGGLFAERDIELPSLDDDSLRIIIEDMSEGFDWSEINPAIFGAIFESTLNPKTRKEGGMHYTFIENIHKVIDPLFMNELAEEAQELLANSPTRQKLRAFQKKLASLTFFDPACGSGNFLTESYLSVRRLENKIIAELAGPQITFAFSKEETAIQVHLEQFIGIEVNDFAVAVAKTALWIAEAQMWNETKSITQLVDDLLPLQHESGIVEADALNTDWAEMLTEKGSVFIMSNPPFLGYSEQTKEQKKAMQEIFGNGKVDYVAGWYWKVAPILRDTRIKAAFVSTTSITQGEQIAYVFKPLRDEFDVHVDFAHTSFVWNSEVAAKEMAHVHCCVVGLVGGKREGRKRLYTDGVERLVERINYYLIEGEEIIAESRNYTLSDRVPPMRTGNRPADGGHLLINTPEELEELLAREPKAEKFIKRFMGGEEFINNIPRWCLWLVDAKPQELHDMPALMKRLKLCKEDRLKGAPDRQKLAKTPALFRDRQNPEHYLAIPKTSSGKREYIPIGWLGRDVIPSDGLLIIPDATLYDFGVLTSIAHMGWTRIVCGRLGSSYRYSARVVYNNFIWPGELGVRGEGLGVRLDPKHYDLITRTAQEILDARAKFPESSFAALYNPLTMPVELRTAHEHNDVAVLAAYGWKHDMPEEEIVARLFEMYDVVANGGK